MYFSTNFVLDKISIIKYNIIVNYHQKLCSVAKGPLAFEGVVVRKYRLNGKTVSMLKPSFLFLIPQKKDYGTQSCHGPFLFT